MLGSSRGPLQADRGPEQVQQRTYAFLPIADISQGGREFPFGRQKVAGAIALGATNKGGLLTFRAISIRVDLL